MPGRTEQESDYHRHRLANRRAILRQIGHERLLHEKYVRMRGEVRFESLATENADIVLVTYGISSRIFRRAVNTARESGLRVGLLRPITLSPFPYSELSRLASRGKKLLVIELNAGQMVEDVMLAAGGSSHIELLPDPPGGQ